MTMQLTKDRAFSDLVNEVRSCTLCPRMCGSTRVLSFAAGNSNSRVMFIGEAPGRLGADQTGIPFHGDVAGTNFENLLSSAGISREQIYISNAALCNPKDDYGNNGTPKPDEILNCSSFLRRQIELVDPAVVVTLGSVALRATSNIDTHCLTLREAVRTATKWFGRILIPLYHPGQRAMMHRSMANQRSDYQFIAETLRRLKIPLKPVSGSTRNDVLKASQYLLRKRGELSYFELHKFAYLAEYLHVRTTGRRLTGAFFMRQKDGPYCTDLHVSRLKRADQNIKVVNREGKLFLRLGQTTNPSLLPETDLDSHVCLTLDEVLTRYTYSNEADLKRAVYLTAPMRLMLRREKREGISLNNAPIDFLTSASAQKSIVTSV